MRNISFAFTTAQFRARAKFVTRRRGWWRAKVGDQLMGVEKSQGLKPGERVVKLGAIEIVEATDEPLNRLMLEPEYGAAEMILEGFPGQDPAEFVRRFVKSHGPLYARRADIISLRDDYLVRRIMFRYL